MEKEKNGKAVSRIKRDMEETKEKSYGYSETEIAGICQRSRYAIMNRNRVHKPLEKVTR